MGKRSTVTEQLRDSLSRVGAVQKLRQTLDKGGVLSCAGVSAGGQSLLGVLAALWGGDRPVVIVTEGVKAQELVHQDVETWLRQLESPGTEADRPGVERALYYPAWEVLPHEDKLPHADVISERLETLLALAGGSTSRVDAPGLVVVTNAIALMQRTLPLKFIQERTRHVRRGEQLDPLDLVEWLEGEGYEPEVQVNHKGQIALRGGILDVYPLTSPWPVRLEFFGNELESIRYFDPVSQMSRETIEETSIPPGGELSLLRRFRADGDFRPATLLDYLPDGAVMIVCEPNHVAVQVEHYANQISAEDPLFASWSSLREQAGRAVWISVREGEPIDPAEVDLGFVSLEAVRPITGRSQEPHVAEAQRREFFSQLHRWLRQGRRVLVFCNNDGERQRFQEIWQEYGLKDPGGGVTEPQTVLGSLSRGFAHDEAGLVVVTDAEIFGRYRAQRPRRLRSPHAQTSRSALDINFADLEEGDYVVHLEHGIGRYLGVQVLPAAQGIKPLEKAQDLPAGGQECLVIEYAARDPRHPAPKLYVPVSEAHLVSKYVGAGKSRPPLNTLGGGRWAKTREHAESAVRDLASEMLAIQAARFSQPGHAFGADTTWQREFESSFLFVETPDQMRSIQQTKLDMEAPRPMDRLICGDVGYGKTEVAIRAAFKAVMAGKQVAVLVPTTVLAQQHYNTFRERMADYPVRIELLSRFRTARQQDLVVESLGKGEADIVIGTHRLIQNDIRFKDLGLVVIDEEQRFGVLHKEKFKRLRTLVDVLTLSATPIPRTLYLALTGARDMSTIETPPQDRLPVETIVTEYDERVIRDAIQRELNRGGQVFYLHNRVFDIETVAHRLRDLLPDARVVVGHGQMPADDLEDVMARFVNGEADVLLSTTIIESGLDIPNANTIIIDHAHRFGLSDLYQLRGRVGRYKHQAYAYLLVPRHARMLTDARKRIAAIRQYSALGSGFKIAMRDLEIRGAGNMLGAQQSGHITAVGFELYCQLLKQSVASLKGEKVLPRVDVPVRLDFLALNVMEEGGNQRPSAAIPPSYVPDSQQRIELYRKLAQITDLAAVKEIHREMRDRFGPLPRGVDLLLTIAELRLIAQTKGISSIETKEDKLMLMRNGEYLQVGGKFPRLTRKDPAARLKEIRQLISAK